jgi:hypothetical protein
MLAQIVTVGIGIWLMGAPALLAVTAAGAASARIVGPLIATCAWIAAAECTRGLRRVNLPLGIWMIVAPLLFEHGTAAALNSSISGAAVAALSFVGGVPTSRYGGGWRALWRSSR